MGGVLLRVETTTNLLKCFKNANVLGLLISYQSKSACESSKSFLKANISSSLNKWFTYLKEIHKCSVAMAKFYF